VDVALATSAAPIYFKAHSLKYSSDLIDGGICANNPAMVALIDAFQFERESKRGTPPPNGFSEGNIRDKVIMISIGTGEQCEMQYDLDELKRAGLWHWAKPIYEVLMESQSKLAHFQAQFILGKSYLRINPLLRFRMELDDHEKIERLKNLSDINRVVSR
jgi:patatin-like phospholipase/acyl hydrolase